MLVPALLIALLELHALQTGADTAKPSIVSTRHPIDSRGETVYEVQGEDEKNVPIVAGVLTPPEVVKRPKLKFSKALKKEKFHGAITVFGVIAVNGDVIDLEADASKDAEAVACAEAALAGARFRAAKLDGKSVASRFKVVNNFHIY